MDNFADLNEWLFALKESPKQIIVEGIKDIRALKALGVPEERISEIKGPLFQFMENVAKQHKEIIILTDLDVEGKKLYAKLNSGLQNLGAQVDKRFREFLFRKTKLSHIEGADSYLESEIKRKNQRKTQKCF